MPKDKNKGTSPFAIAKALIKQKVPFIFKRPRKWRDFKKDAIIIIKWTNGKYHFVIWSSKDKKFLDPLSNYNVRKFGKEDSKRVLVNAFNRGYHETLFL